MHLILFYKKTSEEQKVLFFAGSFLFKSLDKTKGTVLPVPNKVYAILKNYFTAFLRVAKATPRAAVRVAARATYGVLSPVVVVPVLVLLEDVVVVVELVVVVVELLFELAELLAFVGASVACWLEDSTWIPSL